jgi:hypothetical protein
MLKCNFIYAHWQSVSCLRRFSGKLKCLALSYRIAPTSDNKCGKRGQKLVQTCSAFTTLIFTQLAITRWVFVDYSVLKLFKSEEKCRQYVPYRTVPYRTVPYHTVPHRTVPHRTVPYRTVPYRTAPYRGSCTLSSALCSRGFSNVQNITAFLSGLRRSSSIATSLMVLVALLWSVLLWSVLLRIVLLSVLINVQWLNVQQICHCVVSGRLQLVKSVHTGVQGAVGVLDGTSVCAFSYVDLETEF